MDRLDRDELGGARRKMTQIKVFLAGAICGAILGAALLGPIVHVLLIALITVGVAAAAYSGRRLLVARTRDHPRLKA